MRNKAGAHGGGMEEFPARRFSLFLCALYAAFTLPVTSCMAAEAVEDRAVKVQRLETIIRAAHKYAGVGWLKDHRVDVVPVRGTVFLDKNGNGKRDAGEPPVAKVRVSDGYTVVRTGNDGRYLLWSPREFVNIRITIPSRFWPTEPMWGWYQGFDLSQGKGVEADFALQRKKWPARIRFFHCSDLDGGRRSIKNVPKVAAQHPLFIEINDDLPGLYARGRDAWEAYIKPYVENKIPIFATPSNHDCEYGGHLLKDGRPPKGSDNYRWPHRLGRWFWLRNIGPIHFSIDVGGYHLIHVDKYASRIRSGKNRKTGETTWTIWPGSRGWNGSGLPAETVLWLKEDLKFVPKKQPILFFAGDMAGPTKLSGACRYIQEKLLSGYTVHAAWSGEVNCGYGSRGNKFGERGDPEATGTRAKFCGALIFNFGDHGKFFTLEDKTSVFPGEETVCAENAGR